MFIYRKYESKLVIQILRKLLLEPVAAWGNTLRHRHSFPPAFNPLQIYSFLSFFSIPSTLFPQERHFYSYSRDFVGSLRRPALAFPLSAVGSARFFFQ
jgi:hypothetical protein